MLTNKQWETHLTTVSKQTYHWINSWSLTHRWYRQESSEMAVLTIYLHRVIIERLWLIMTSGIKAHQWGHNIVVHICSSSKHRKGLSSLQSQAKRVKLASHKLKMRRTKSWTLCRWTNTTSMDTLRSLLIGWNLSIIHSSTDYLILSILDQNLDNLQGLLSITGMLATTSSMMDDLPCLTGLPTQRHKCPCSRMLTIAQKSRCRINFIASRIESITCDQWKLIVHETQTTMITLITQLHSSYVITRVMANEWNLDSMNKFRINSLAT